MAKKTASSRSRAQRNGSRPKQKGFELVRPSSDVNVLETAESSEETAIVEEVEEKGEEVVESIEVKEKVQAAKRVVTTESASAVAAPASPTSSAPKSAAARLAARRQSAQQEKNQRTQNNLILAENYGYVRKDLLFILILALVLLAIILTLHFIPSVGSVL